MKPIIPSINYHLTKACNMKCKFCFATFNDLGVVKHDLDFSLKIIKEIAENGFEKITFAGGEPTLVKELPLLLKYAKDLGLVTSIVSNGSNLNTVKHLDEISKYTDWIAISIDSTQDQVNLNSGRAIRGTTVLTEQFYVDLIENLKSKNVKIKINTVVSKYNYMENFEKFIFKIKPNRWKILQAIKVDGQNSPYQDEFNISSSEFSFFVNHNKRVIDAFENAIEPKHLIKGSYLMISPEGKLYDNNGDSYQYSSPILEVGLKQALCEIQVDKEKFTDRNGFYNWN